MDAVVVAIVLLAFKVNGRNYVPGQYIDAEILSLNNRRALERLGYIKLEACCGASRAEGECHA